MTCMLSDLWTFPGFRVLLLVLGLAAVGARTMTAAWSRCVAADVVQRNTSLVLVGIIVTAKSGVV